MFFRQPMKKDKKVRFGGKKLSTKAPPESPTIEITKTESITVEQDDKQLAEIIKVLKEDPPKVQEKTEVPVVLSVSACQLEQVPEKEYYVFVGLQATCFPKIEEKSLNDTEIIEFSALLVDKKTKEVISTFEQVIRPVLYPVLSDWCKEITGIDQEIIDTAQPFSVMANHFAEWCALFPGKKTIIAWGEQIINQYLLDCKRAKRESFDLFDEALDLQAKFSEVNNYKNFFSLKSAMKKTRTGFEGSFTKSSDVVANTLKMAKTITGLF